MGKQWQFCASGGGGRDGGRREAGSPPGCLSVVFQLFDFHRQVPSNFNSASTNLQPNHQLPILKEPGIEAPRNSFEKEEPSRQPPSLSSAMKMEDNLHIPMGIQIKTRVEKVRSTTSEYSLSPDYQTSPGAKTPTLVARLMGLDLLPDTSSPSPSYSNRSSNSKPLSKSHLKSNEFNRKDKNLTGVCSLPETPRVSLARKSDVDRRLSLQSNRDSVGEIELSGGSRIRIVKREIREDDEVKERVKQIKEGVVNRRFGVEITNRLKNRGPESEIVLLKAKKPLNNIIEEMGPSKYSMKLLEKEKQNQRILNREIGKKNVLKNKQTEPFVRSNLRKNRKLDLVNEKKCKRNTPLSTSVLLVKKEPSFPPTKLPPKQKQVSNSLKSKRITQLSSSSGLKYRQLPEDKSTVQCTTSQRSSGCTSTTICTGQQLFHYIKDILIHNGIYKDAPTLITKLSSMSIPFDPLVFNLLELSHSHFSFGCNRKLIFELVHEILGEILGPEFKPCGLFKVKDLKICGSELIEKLCEKIKSFPLANCQVLDDIDALIDGDLRSSVAFEEVEGAKVVSEIGVEILDSIVQELAMDIL